MLRVSGDALPLPTNAMLSEPKDQLAPRPLNVPPKLMVPGASSTSAPPELKREPASSSRVAPAPAPERAAMGRSRSDTARSAALGSVSVNVSAVGSVPSGVPAFPGRGRQRCARVHVDILLREDEDPDPP